jgi:long-chain acyl-CoA synthetase
LNFLERIHLKLLEGGDRPALREGAYPTRARDLLAMVAGARAFLRRAGVRPGDRVALLGDNGARWVALDLAVMGEGALTVPLYSRQAPGELARMLADCAPALLLSDTRDRLAPLESSAPRACLFEEAFGEGKVEEPLPRAPSDPVRIVYTSGTSGEPKGAVLTLANVDFMLPRVLDRVEEVMAGHKGEERVFHYLPCCFAGSWILMLGCLARGTLLAFSTDLEKLKEELRAADPHWMLNVPLLLERMRAGISKELGGLRGPVGWIARRPSLARLLLYPAIRRRIAPSLRALICGSAPLAEETQRFFMMLGLPVLQVYGLTETTAICTMDRPGEVVPGRVGRAVDGCEMRLDPNGEILVRGPNVFPGYWGREPQGEWLATGDLGEPDERGNWKIVGRAKYVIVLASGHNVPPEPIEERLRASVRGATQVMLVGHGRKCLGALVAGSAERADVERSLAAMNEDLPHYRRVRPFLLCPPFSQDDGLLTANGKLKRDAILLRYRDEIEDLFL